MKIKGFEIKGGDIILHTSPADAMRFAVKNDPFKKGEYEIERVYQKRSLRANAYLWALCSRIADKLGVTKEDVYRRNIRGGGMYTPLPIKEDAVESFSKIWAAHGTGWFCEVIDDSEIPGYKLVFAYQGSSTYDSKQMWQLIERVKADAESVGVETLPPNEVAAMMQGWERRGA